jgi:hypothetical protein
MRIPILVAALFLAGTAGAREAVDYPFLGSWDCGVGVFEFTVDSYTPPGSNPLPILEVRREDENFILLMPDGYEVGLSSVGETTMAWFSFASGDSFDCTRVD